MRRSDLFALLLLCSAMIVGALAIYFAAARLHEAERHFDLMIADRRCAAFAAAHRSTTYTATPRCVVTLPDGSTHAGP